MVNRQWVNPGGRAGNKPRPDEKIAIMTACESLIADMLFTEVSARSSDDPQPRRKLYQGLERGPQLESALACAQDYLAAVRAAIAARNGWKRILQACAPPRVRRTRSQDQPA